MKSEELYLNFFHKVKHTRSLQKQADFSKSKAIKISAKTAETELDQLTMQVEKKLQQKGLIKNG